MLCAAIPCAHAELIFFDDFEYEVNRATLPSDESGIQNPFITQGGWTRAKAVNITGSHLGYLYTTQTVHGYTGAMPPGRSPGNVSQRVLKMELSTPQSGGSDFYLQFGDSEVAGNENRIPANVWFQFWHFTNNSGDEQSRVHNRHKFIYPCSDPYGCQTNRWRLSLTALTYNPLNQQPFGNPSSNGAAYLVTRDHSIGTANYSLAGAGDESKLGQFNTTEYLQANRWQLVKIHFDTSNTASGVFEAWIKPLGSTNFTKVAEWIGGVTPNFTWTFPAAGGHRAFRMPTTIGWDNGVGPVWYYMDDFAMATSEADLPVYSVGIAAPMPPSSVTLQHITQ